MERTAKLAEAVASEAKAEEERRKAFICILD